jgi:hypothetical protein
MERLIGWDSGVFDEIELVYGKAEGKPELEAPLRELEAAALEEVRRNCRAIRIGGRPLTEEDVDRLSGSEKEQIIATLGNAGLKSFFPSMEEPVITAELSPLIPRVMSCTIFNVLNRLEKLDGSYDTLFPKASLRFRVPLGGRKGLFKGVMLIVMLYPWLSVQEQPTNELAVDASGLG